MHRKTKYDGEDNSLPPSHKWRELYQCRKRKGNHLFKLYAPDGSDPDVFYEKEKRKGDGTFGVFYRYRCVDCGKQEMKWGRWKKGMFVITRNKSIKDELR